MDNGSFAYLDQRTPKNRPVIIAGVIVLILAVLGAIAAGIIAAGRDDAQHPTTPETITVTAAPEQEEDPRAEDADRPAPDTYAGSLVSVAEDDTAGRSWQAVATFAGDNALMVYPSTGCAMYLEAEADGQWSSQALSDACAGTGAWQITYPGGGLLELAFVTDDEQVLVEGTLSAVSDPADTASAQ
ncbi:hypothetical protein C3B44_07480 [Corynebacterium yudongzhengii]|uniref:Uncharacterized protein n=1 Tax=Corynebacterium yudongzhengii TaxID=2080740 RepID=A0A2U1T6N8_9CORY|nr:hypothetical protein [Corynebacterium yudongzhengii]AWB82214.1 hypothetical protein C3B44_07480 [Corynebacterium yudongzhengii]PWC01664.1 hypothetical protein DF222_06005 [Corynebacterium yudongzhengii]